MTTIAVTGAAGSVGRRVVRLLAADDAVDLVVGLDRVGMAPVDGAQFHQVDVVGSDVSEHLDGCDAVVHLAEDPGRRTDEEVATTTLTRVLEASGKAGCGHVVLLSSALVYGAYADNPIPLTEHHPRRPLTALAYASTKARLEEEAEAWAHATNTRLTILRPTTTLSERGVSYIAGALRAATSLRPEQVDPPVQFLHHDDLASAVALVATAARGPRVTVYNVAPDGWIGAEVFRDLASEAEFRWPQPVDDALARVSRIFHNGSIDDGLEGHVTHPWVVANDRLRAAGWLPEFTNEEAYVLGNPAPPWRTFANRRRQELALGAFGAAGLAAIAGAAWVLRRVLRP